MGNPDLHRPVPNKVEARRPPRLFSPCRRVRIYRR
jgi:hypothetical protein